ncbi:hypothetical protein [uncultured Rikenella sp.]|uniref:hypothetical protein n=1 Tax=uncultured Rikenella sp. TaxID=368003 RepID=UPI00262EEE78|nr:hypothetical protein [uncultured Rikenella sp.]
MIRGFAIATDNMDRTGTGIARLRRYGVDGIEVAESWERAKERFLEVAELLKEGDKLVVCSLGDVCRGVEELLEVFLTWSRKRFVLVSLDEGWLEECRDALLHGGGELLLSHIHRYAPVLAGKQGAKRRETGGKRCVQGGRPKGSIKMNAEKLDLAVRMYCQGDFTVRDICDIVRCNERSMYRYLKLRGVAGMRKVSGTAAASNEDVNHKETNHSAAPEN